MNQQSPLRAVEEAHARFQAGSETTDHGQQPPGDSDSPRRGASKGRSVFPLPTDRLKFDYQVEVLRNVAITSGNNKRGSTAQAMSAAIGMTSGTGGLNSKFFKSAGWFEPVGRGEYTASPGVLAWNQHTAVMPDEKYAATAGMREEARSSWFWRAVEPILASGQPIKKQLVLLQLTREAGTSSHGVQIGLIVDWLEWVGLVSISDGLVTLRPETETSAPPLTPQAQPETSTPPLTPQAEPEPLAAPTEEAHLARETSAVFEPGASASAMNDVGAMVSFNMSVRLTADDIERMDQEQRTFVLALAERLRG